MNALNDINGKESSKRLWGGRYLLTALLMAVIYFLVGVVFSAFGKEMTFIFPYEIWYGMVAGGFSILGITIFESKTK